jgi:rubrerythrin
MPQHHEDCGYLLTISISSRDSAMEMEAVCYTREGALRKVIELLQKSLESYLKAYKLSNDQQARDLIKHLVLEEIDHKCALEKALFGETISFHDNTAKNEVTVKLPHNLKEKPLDENSTPSDVLIYAINNKKRSVVFCATMAFNCADAPMEHLFKKLLKEETNHLARLEKLYEHTYLEHS